MESQEDDSATRIGINFYNKTDNDDDEIQNSDPLD